MYLTYIVICIPYLTARIETNRNVFLSCEIHTFDPFWNVTKKFPRTNHSVRNHIYYIIKFYAIKIYKQVLIFLYAFAISMSTLL